MTMKIGIWEGFCLGHKACSKSLNTPRRPRNTYNLKSFSEKGRSAAANSSNNAFAFCINWVTDSSPCWRSWRDPWSCIIRELNVEARACLSVRQTELEVWQSTTRWRTFTNSKESRALKMSWSCYFQRRKEWFTWREVSSATSTYEGQEFEPSTNPKTPWPMRYNFICIRQYR